ncbi:MAG: hypothetical protein IPJ50_16495 [Betaproteobacteria bacterium]|nr:hypothetical protein [Betaproteobacteria bacterium]
MKFARHVEAIKTGRMIPQYFLLENDAEFAGGFLHQINPEELQDPDAQPDNAAFATFDTAWRQSRKLPGAAGIP